MKIYRTVIALFVLAALVIPQPTPVQSAPLNAKSTINLQPGDSATATCPTILIPKVLSQTKLRVLCSPAKFKKGGAATPTPMPTATATPTATPTANQPLVLAVAMQPGDVIIVTCPTRLIPKYASRKSGKVLCRAAIAASTATATQVSVPTETESPAPTETESPAPTETESPVSTETQPSSESTATSTHTQDPIPTFTQTFTNTPIPSTITSTPTRTPTSPTGGNIQPYAGAPACPTHNPNQWHGLWDATRGCHYNHTHGDDPSLADKYFGPLGAYWNGTTISYPFNSGPSENTLKHAGYKISVRMPGYHDWKACGLYDNTDITGDHSDNCIVASRIEYHAVGGLMDLVGRYHSYWLEVYICKGQPSPFPPPNSPNCGIMRTGGLLDFAQLQAPHYNARVVRPGGTLDFGNGIVMTYNADGAGLPSNSGEPYVFSYPNTAQYINQFRNSPHSVAGTSAGGSYQITIDQWSSNDFDCDPRPPGDPCHNQYTHVLYQVGDAFNLVNPQNLNDIYWICYGQPNCEYDGSMIGMNETQVRVLQSWQPSGNGFVTVNGWSDKWGNPTSGCTAISTDCVPFILENAPVGVAATKSNRACLCDVWEYDVYFAGKPSGWIEFPN